MRKNIISQARKNISDPTHILHCEYQLFPSGRHYRVIQCRLNRYKHSFISQYFKAIITQQPPVAKVDI